jgi:hypothetical protein
MRRREGDAAAEPSGWLDDLTFLQVTEIIRVKKGNPGRLTLFHLLQPQSAKENRKSLRVVSIPCI